MRVLMTVALSFALTLAVGGCGDSETDLNDDPAEPGTGTGTGGPDLPDDPADPGDPDDPTDPGDPDPPDDPPDDPPPIPDDVPDDGTWAFIPVDGMECMDDSPTGIGINPNSASDKLLIYFEGGGACFNNLSCLQVAHPNGYDESDLESFVRFAGSSGVFDRENPDNPFADYSFVFVPYCTGDIHAGTNPQGFGRRNQVGYLNVASALPAIMLRFPKTNNVVLSGSSAGGFGALANFDQVQIAFGDDVPVTMLDDSGPPLPQEFMTQCFQEMIDEAWGLSAALPDDCPECQVSEDSGLHNILPYLAGKYPNRRFAIISSLSDSVMSLFFGFGYPRCSGFPTSIPSNVMAEAVTQLQEDIAGPYPNVGVFTVTGSKHVFLLDAPISTRSGGTMLIDWMQWLVDDDDQWGSVTP